MFRSLVFDNLVMDIILIMSIRFFLFDFYLLQPIWRRLRKLNNYFISHFLLCPFCQGFWVSFIFSLTLYDIGFIKSFAFGFINGFINYVYYFTTYKLLYCNETLKMKHVSHE